MCDCCQSGAASPVGGDSRGQAFARAAVAGWRQGGGGGGDTPVERDNCFLPQVEFFRAVKSVIDGGDKADA